MIVAAKPSVRRIHEKEDFSYQDLSHADLSNSKFAQCNFDYADLSEANCSHSNFAGSSFKGSICYRTNFANAKLGATIFEPRDCYGMTVTLECGSFQNMHVSPLWWYAWLILLSLMLPVTEPGDDLKSKLIAMIGAERYVKLRSMFSRRDT